MNLNIAYLPFTAINVGKKSNSVHANNVGPSVMLSRISCTYKCTDSRSLAFLDNFFSFPQPFKWDDVSPLCAPLIPCLFIAEFLLHDLLMSIPVIWGKKAFDSVCRPL